MPSKRRIDVSRKASVDSSASSHEDNELRRPPTGKSHALDDCEKTAYYCKKCGKMKFRCSGCGKIVCFCEKRNNHIVGDVFVLCLPPMS